MRIPPDFWNLSRQEFEQRARAHCDRLFADLMSRFDMGDQKFGGCNLFNRDFRKERWEEAVDHTSYGLMEDAKDERMSTLARQAQDEEWL